MLHNRDGRILPLPTFYEERLGLSLNSKERLPKILSFILILFLVVVAWGQDENNISEPPSPSIIYKLDSGRLIPLEFRIIQVGRVYHAWGFAGVTMVYRVGGEKSYVRFKAESGPEFVVRLKGKLDPLETVQFYHFNELNGSRVVPIVDVDILERLSNYNLATRMVDFNALKYGASSFKLIPIQALMTGEYCLIIKPTNRPEKTSPGFCFGVDAAGS